jgi:hypothetical protein
MIHQNCRRPNLEKFLPTYLRGVVVSDGEKADLSRQLSDEKMSKSEPLKTHRKVFQKLSKRAQIGGARKSVDVTCLRSTRQPI